MTAETAEAEAPPVAACYQARDGEILALTAGAHGICEDTLAANPQWKWAFSDAGPVRPPTDEEAAAYAAHASDPDWADIYHPAPPSPPPAREEIDWQTAVADSTPLPLPSPAAARDEAAETRIQQDATRLLMRLGARPEDFPAGVNPEGPEAA